jgi:hypothetical protein
MTLDQEKPTRLEETLEDLLRFPLMESLTGRRSRRFCMGAEIPDGVLAFKSKHKPMPLSELEQLLLLSTMGGVTGWQGMSWEQNLPRDQYFEFELESKKWLISIIPIQKMSQLEIMKTYQLRILNQTIKDAN